MKRFFFCRTEPQLLVSRLRFSARLHVSFSLVKASRKFDSSEKKENMSRVAAELLNKSETLIMACCIVPRDGSDVFGVSTFYSFSPGSMKWHSSSARLCNSRDVLRFESL